MSGTVKRIIGPLTYKLDDYFDSPELSDITIKVGSKSFPAHRFILGTRCSGLAKMMEDSPGDVLVIDNDATDKEAKVFRLVVKFIYTGMITFTADTVNMILGLANRLTVEGLSRMAQEYMGRGVEKGGVLSALTWLRDIEGSDLHTLQDKCLSILALNFEYISEDSWLDLSFDNVLSILDMDDVVVGNEEAVIRRVDSWLAAKGGYEDNEPLRMQYDTLASKIRLPFVGTYNLGAMRETSLIVKYIAHSAPTLLREAITYQSICAELAPILEHEQRKPCGEDSNDPRCLILKDMTQRPRLYLDFQAPGQSETADIHGKLDGSTTAIRFKKFPFHYFLTIHKLDNFVQTCDGLWEARSDCLLIRVNAIECEMDPTEGFDSPIPTTEPQTSWKIQYIASRTYELTLKNFCYRIVIVARPLDKDAQFYLHDNPTVSILSGTKSSAPGPYQEFVRLVTPPLFVGRKPYSIEFAIAAFINPRTKSDKMEN